ncbi:MAG TPA: fructosamine kinase family protein, partial [Microlunatus sp.]|nr:fructosamine kinase family protein [Microlunatus sp.]
MTSRLLDPRTVEKVEEAVSAHVGRTWRISSWTDLAERASHPAVILRDETCAVFAKLAAADEAKSQVSSELAGLRLLAEAGIPVPVPVGRGRVDLADDSAVLLFEALDERTDRSTEDWQAIGRVLANLHAVEGGSYGAAADGFFGPLKLENGPVDPHTWVEFYARRRVQPWLRTARDAGSVDAATAARVEAL